MATVLMSTGSGATTGPNRDGMGQEQGRKEAARSRMPEMMLALEPDLFLRENRKPNKGTCAR